MRAAAIALVLLALGACGYRPDDQLALSRINETNLDNPSMNISGHHDTKTYIQHDP
jgi:hypothetical protein